MELIELTRGLNRDVSTHTKTSSEQSLVAGLHVCAA